MYHNHHLAFGAMGFEPIKATTARRHKKSNKFQWMVGVSPLTLAACGGNMINQINGNGQINIGNTNNGESSVNIGSDNVGDNDINGADGSRDDISEESPPNNTDRVIFGTANNDMNLSGTSGDDIIDPLGGNDKVFAFAGADKVYLGSGSKYIDFGIDNSSDMLIVKLNEVNGQSTIVNFSYSNEDIIQFEGALYDGFDRTPIVTSEDRDDFVNNIKVQRYISSLGEDGIHMYLFNYELGAFGSRDALNFREAGDLQILQFIEAALEDVSSGDNGLGVLSGSTSQVQNAIDGSKLILSIADTYGNVAWIVYEEAGGDLDFGDELSLVLVTSMTTSTAFSGDLVLPGQADIS